MQNIKVLLRVLFVISLLSSCASNSTMYQSYDKVDNPAKFSRSVEIGDYVEITTFDGKKYEFQVTARSSDSISSHSLRVEVKDIAALKVLEVSFIKITLWTLLFGGLTAFILENVLIFPLF